MYVCFVYLIAVSCVHVYERQIAPSAISEAPSWHCTNQQLYDLSYDDPGD